MFLTDDHILDYVDAYLHGVLGAAMALRVERHCERCRICQVAMEEARIRFAAMQNVPRAEAPQELIQGTLLRIDKYEQRRPLRRRLRAGAAAAAVLAVLSLAGLHRYYFYLAPTPYDLTVLGQTQLIADTTASLRIRLTDHTSGAALAGVPVVVQLTGHGSTPLELSRFTTDAAGTGQPRFHLPDWESGRYELRITARPSGHTEVVTQTIQLQRSWKVMLSSDKPVYQPGQTIHVRALALRKLDQHPAADQAVVFSITDPRGNVIFKRSGTTSKFGIAACDCPLAGEVAEGAYAVQCSVGDTESKRTVEVKKYVLPRFQVSVVLDQPYYEPGQTLRGKVRAKYFFGKPVTEAPVQVELKIADGPARLISSSDARTDASGEAAVEWKLPGALSGQQHTVSMVVEAMVTDAAGQKQAARESRELTTQPLRVEVIPEGGSLVPGVTNRLYVFAHYADGRPAQVRVAVEMLEPPVATKHPRSGTEVIVHHRDATTDELGVAVVDVKPTRVEAGLKVQWTDEARKTTPWEDVPLVPGAINRNFVLRTDKAVYDAGATVQLVALGGGVEPVFIDLIKDGQTILTEAIAMTEGHGEYQFDLSPELSGTVQLCAYRFGDDGLPLRKARVLYIRPAHQLHLDAAVERPEHRPGDRAKVRFTLTDNDGRPAPGAVSLAAVDEAVFSVLDQAPGMEKTFYTLERELLQPVYTIYPWSPELPNQLPAAQRERLEQALFARTVRFSQGQQHHYGGSRPIQNQALAAASPFSLDLSSFPDKVQQVEETRRVALAWMTRIWLTLLTVAVALGAIAGIVLAVRTIPRQVLELGVAGAIIVLICFIMITSLGTNANGTFAKIGTAINATFDQSEFRQAKEFLAAPPLAMESDLTGQWGQNPEPPSVRVRESFPETLLWQPELITDDAGRATLDVDLADSITTWRLTASAVTADGRLGATQASIRVFQPFFVELNLPLALTRGDEVAIPVVVYNYLDKPQTVELTLADAAWCQRLGDAVQRLDLPAHAVLSTSYRLRVTRVGRHELQVTARGSGIADAVKRPIEVLPDGRRVEQVVNGVLREPAEIDFTVPDDAIPGSTQAILKLYPSSFSQLVEGLDGIFRMPYGCFEQTSSTTYPNVLALDYLRRTQKSAPAVEARARQYLHLGYQRLVGFEVSGGGFDWFGRPPANRTLTAYGLMEFQDMARVHDVDPRLIQRTRRWLLEQRQLDGSWAPEGHMLHEDPTRRGEGNDLARYSTTAYIAWAVLGGQPADSQASSTRDYLLRRSPETFADAHVLALTCNALLAVGATPEASAPYFERLVALQRSSPDGKLIWWELPAAGCTTFYGAGRSGSVETTALASLALLSANRNPGITSRALAWLVQQKDADGTWRSTQATVLALKALLAATGKPGGEERERRIDITWGQGGKRTVIVPADQSDVLQQIDLSEALTAGRYQFTVTERSDTETGFQLTCRCHVPGTRPEKAEPLSITVAYDRTELPVEGTIAATATVVNRQPQSAPMVVLDLPIPGGFAIETSDLEKLVAAEAIARYQVTPRQALVYLRDLPSGKALQVRYRLRATMAVKVTVPAARVYEYYDVDKQGFGEPTQLTATPR
jgi:hypothetical protein